MKIDNRSGGPLAGLRIIDITEVVMGPSATQMLADLGADIIKVEPPGGDMLRATGPGGRAGAGPLFLNLNRNKRSIVLDLKHPAGKEALLRLAKDADALVYNVRPQAMKRLGLDYEAVRLVNPQIVYVGMFGFSQRGRYASARAFDDMIQAAVAIPEASVRAGSDVPRYAPVNLADRATGLYAFGVICAALLARERTGTGQAVDVPMFETIAQLVLGDHLYGHTFVPARGGFGYPRLLNRQRRPYPTKDGLVCCVVYTNEQWTGFMRAVGEAEFFETDPRFADGESRTQHVEALYDILAEKLVTKTTKEWRELLEPLGIPVLESHTFDSLLEDPHLRDIGFFQEYEHPTEGALRTMAVASEWAETPLPPLRPPPLLGEHSAEVLSEAGYSVDDIRNMIESGVTQVSAARGRTAPADGAEVAAEAVS
jgi:crotonobetainyl-CoA:carnitine CoA-transferase CaiB-like acyl-CoA transferase